MALDKRKLSKAVKDKYLFENETFKRVAKDNPKDKIEVEIGDSKQPDFKPQVKIQRWDNEVNLSFRLKDDGVEEEIVETKGEEIVWKKGKREVRFYDLPESEALPEGGYEFEVVLLEKPATNVVEFSLNTKGLRFFYQPPLNQEQLLPGHTATETTEFDASGNIVGSRPENIVGSYAVYSSERKINYVGGKEYKCGKIGHIYRPQIEDANGVKVWGELSVDTKKGTLSVTIPQEFLDNAVYPVRHAAGLTLGYTTTPGTAFRTLSAGNEGRASVRYNSPDNGTVSSISVYCNYITSSVNVKHFLLLQTGSSIAIPPNGVTPGAAPPSAAGWSTINYTSRPSLESGVDYRIGTVRNTGLNNVQLYADSTSFGHTCLAAWTAGYATPVAPSYPPSGDLDREYGMYITYTASAAGFPFPHSPVDTDFTSSVTSMAVNMPAAVNSGDRLIAIVHYRNAGTWTTVPTGWSNLAEQGGGGSVGEMAVFEKIADGTEDGGTATWVTGTGTTAAWQVIRISGAHASTAAEVTTTSGDSSSADPPSESASWGAENNLWLAVAGHSAASAAAFTIAPTNYLGFASNGASSGGSACSIAVAYRQLNASSEDPGTFTAGGSNRWWAAATIAVRPAATGGGGGGATPTLMLMGMGT